MEKTKEVRMMLKLTEKMRTLDGVPMQQVEPDGKSAELVVKSVVIECLLRPHRSEDNVSGAEKLRRFDLATRINKCGEEVELSVDEAALVKELLLAKGFPVLIVGQMCAILEGKNR